jgi:AmmeMemoRadiSam system protein B
VQQELRRALTQDESLFVEDERFHRYEHAVEVELPLLELAWPGATILPVEVPLVENAVLIGRATAQRITGAGIRAVFLASSDLTHYGPAYRFAPAGVGITGLRFAMDNDRRLLDRIEHYDVERIVPEVRESLNACGGGAIAAMLSACREMGASRVTVLRHQNSYQTLAQVQPQQPDNAVGYAGIVVS